MAGRGPECGTATSPRAKTFCIVAGFGGEEDPLFEADDEGEEPLSWTRKWESTSSPPDLGSRASCQLRDSGGGEVGDEEEEEEEDEGGVMEALG